MRSTLVLSLFGSTFMLACATAVTSGDDTSGDSYPDAAPASDAAWKPGYDASYHYPDASTTDPDASVDPDADLSETSTPLEAGGPCAFSGTLATYDFTGQPGNQASTKATSSASNVTAGDVSRSGKITAVSGSNSINGSAWSTASLDGTKYYTLTLTPASSCAMDITSVSIDSKASSTGPSSGAVATSDDSFVSTTAFSPGSSGSVSLSVSGATGAIEIRVYGYNASGSGGTFRIQNTLTVSGSLK